jgi:hypothetical protein
MENGTCAIASTISLVILLSNKKLLKTVCVYQVAISQEPLKIVCLYQMDIISKLRKILYSQVRLEVGRVTTDNNKYILNIKPNVY